MKYEETIGLSVFLPNCSFQVEVGRNNLKSIFSTMDSVLEENNILGNAKKAEQALIDTFQISNMLVEEEMTTEDAVSELSFNMLYIYSKTVSPTIKKKIRGIVGVLEKDRVVFTEFLDEATYRAMVGNVMDHSPDEYVDRSPVKPTIH